MLVVAAAGLTVNVPGMGLLRTGPVARLNVFAVEHTTIQPESPGLDPGHYQAKRKVLSADGDITEGVVTFTVVTSPAPQ